MTPSETVIRLLIKAIEADRTAIDAKFPESRAIRAAVYRDPRTGKTETEIIIEGARVAT